MAHNTAKTTIALKKAKSSLDKVFRMIEEDKYCIDIIQQNLAIIGLLRSANQSLLDGHVNGCIKDAIKKNNTKRTDEMMVELLKVIKIAQSK